jgi:hypothetical protein
LKVFHMNCIFICTPICTNLFILVKSGCYIFLATKENSELKYEVAYLSAGLERTKVSEKMNEDDLS